MQKCKHDIQYKKGVINFSPRKSKWKSAINGVIMYWNTFYYKIAFSFGIN